MRLYSFNDFKYVCYVEGKDKAIESCLPNYLKQES